MFLSVLAFLCPQVDALHPAVAAFRTTLAQRTDSQTGLDALSEAVKVCPTLLGLERVMQIFMMVLQAAVAGAAATVNMSAQAGRASYVHSSQLTQPDPGAHAVAIWLKAIHSAFD